MIQLHKDFLFVETPPGQIIPCAAELVAVELIGEAAGSIESELIRQAAAAVLHYFRTDLGRTSVTVAEFARALEQALQSLGVATKDLPDSKDISSFDLRQLASNADKEFELSFFPKLRAAVRDRANGTAKVLHFHGLRHCVKSLIGAKRWTPRCQNLNDQIVGYLRDCLILEAPTLSCDVVVR